MARTFSRQATQIRNSLVYDDNITVGATMESAIVDIEGDLNALRSQVKRAIWDDDPGNWFDDIPTINAKKRGIRDLNFDLDELESQKVLCRESLLTDISVTSTQNWELLNVAASETPGTVAAVAASQVGAVVAQSTLGAGAPFLANELTEVSSGNATYPKNLMIVRDSTTGQPIQSGGRDIFALLQYETGAGDGLAFDDATRRAKLSFVRMNTGLDDLEAVPVADIELKTINYAWVRRYQLDDVPEDCFLGQSSFVDASTNADMTRQRAYDTQGTTAVELDTNATLDLDTAGITWIIRDLANANLLRILEGSGGGTSEIQFGADVDVFNNDAILNDFAAGLKAATGGVEIDVGVTVIANVGTIETLAGNDLRMLGARELFLDDGNQTGSTWGETNGIKLSDTTGEWDDYETVFGGEVSLLRGIYLAASTGSRGVKTHSNVTVDAAADAGVSFALGNLDVALPDMSGGTFATSHDVYLNGNLLRGGADLSANNDYYPGSTTNPAELKFEFALKVNDVLCVIPWA